MSKYSDLIIEGLSDPKLLNTVQCLSFDTFIDSDHYDIMNLVKELSDEKTSDWNKAKAVFEFVRDEIEYNFAPLITKKEDWKASEILRKKNGMCHQKTILQVALLRSLKVPAAFNFQNIIDAPLLKSRYKAMIPDGILHFHALAVTKLEGKWYRLDATLDRGLCDRRGYCISQIEKGKETLLPSIKRNGNPHFKIIKDHGYFTSYPEEFLLSFLSHKNDWDYWRKFVRREHLSM